MSLSSAPQTRRLPAVKFGPALIFLAALAPPMPAQDAAVPAITIPRVKRPPKLSDFLNNVPREAEAIVTDFRQFDPGDGAPVTQPTTAFLSYDDKNLYVGWICKDDPKLIRSRVAKRKDILNDDRVTINIDTFHDHRHAYWFDVNAYGVQLDGITTDGYGDDFSWESLWYTESKITRDGYVVLETIPFKSLRFSSATKQRWAITLARFITRNNEFACWPWISRRKLPAFVAQFGHMDGLEDISPGHNSQIIPYVSSSASRYLNQPQVGAPGYVTDIATRAGVDAKTVIKDALTLDLTLNPDFSQVESDEPQVTVNQRYEVFFPEKRPFFMENASYFALPQQLFFSRRIIDPQFGVRLTGKLGRWALGVLSADDRAPGKRASSQSPAFGHRAIDSVLSLQRDLKQDSHLRLFVTDREIASSYNRVASLDTRWRLSRSWFLIGQAANSQTRDLNNSTSSGNILYGGLTHNDRHFQSTTSYTDRGPGFRADLGYIPRVDIRELRQTLNYRWRPEKKTLVSFGPGLKVLRNWNRAGRTQDWEISPSLTLELLRLTSLEVGHRQVFELYRGITFRQRFNYAQFSSEPYKALAFNANYTTGDGVNYYPAAGLLPFLARTITASLGFTLRPTPRLRLDEAYLFSRLSLPSAVIYNNHIARSKVNYQFTRELSLRAIVDYNGVLPNSSLVALDRAKRLGYDILFTWLLHPGTALYAGYTDIYENMAFDPSRPPYLQPAADPALNTGRQAFIKLSYLFRF